jgi:hypothetical protein
MRRRTVLRSLSVGAVGVSVGTAAGHPEPTGDGGTTPASTPTDGEPLGTLDLSGAHELVTSPDGHTAYVATGDGVVLVDIVSPTTPRMLAERTDLLADSEAGPMEQVQDLAVADDRLLVVGPAHPADGAHGLVVFDVSDRQNPERVAAYRTETGIHNCDFDGRYAYLTGNDRDDRPLVVVDTEAGQEVGTWSLLDVDERWSAVNPVLRPIHDVTVSDEYAAVAYWDAGTWLLDISDPADISLVARVRGRDRETLAGVKVPFIENSEPPGNDHYVAIDDATGLLAVGAESWDVDDYGSGGPSGIELFDISDPENIVSLATIDPPPTSDPTPGGVLTTAHNFELTDGRLYSAWYNGGVRVHDVRDPTEPRELYRWRDSADTSFWTAQRGDGCFVATSTNANGGSEVTPGVYTFPDPAFGQRATDTPTGADGDGFGVLAALGAVAVGAWRLGRRRSSL